MADHDPMCLSADLGCEHCQTNLCLCEHNARVRADERERNDGGLADALDIAKAERDTARAEVRALLSIRAILEGEIARLTSERDTARAEADNLRAAASHERTRLLMTDRTREALADLRTKIQQERDTDQRYINRDSAAVARIEAYNHVLFLIEEAEEPRRRLCDCTGYEGGCDHGNT